MKRSVIRQLISAIFRLERTISKAITHPYFRWRVRMSAASCGEGLVVNRRSTVTSNTHLGDYVNFNGLHVSGNGRVTIGRYFHSGKNCLLITSFHNYESGSRIPYGPRSEDLHRDIEIGEFVWLGDQVTILGGAKIGEGAVIQAGSVIVSDIPDLAIAGGHPARVFKYRDKERFSSLKAKGMFF